MDPTRTAPDSKDDFDDAKLTAQLWIVFPRRELRIMRQGLLIGRSGPLEPWLKDDANISREHARIFLEDGRWFITDLGSRNGTTVNGGRLQPSLPCALGTSSILRVGDVLLIFIIGAIDGEPRDDRHLPGRSPAMHRLRAELAHIAGSHQPLLILGETGTGKEFVARWLHRERTPDGPFVEVNCAQLSKEFARSELFGILPGTASGVSGREGLVRAARDGTLFLDEIGDLPEDVQPELLRYLQNGTYLPLGGTTLERSDARVIAATHRDLAGEVDHGTFRRDLYARLTAAGDAIRVPALRERAVDILEWAGHFLPGRALSPGAAETLLIHPWLANLRELERVMKTAGGKSPADQPIRRNHLPIVRAESPDETAAPVQKTPLPSHSAVLELTPDMLSQALVKEKGNVVRAAELLGVHRRAIYRAADRFEIDLNAYRPKDDNSA
jgi:DNA-binding NtrC family response regulator